VNGLASASRRFMLEERASLMVFPALFNNGFEEKK
jgi:hypothetical protein